MKLTLIIISALILTGCYHNQEQAPKRIMPSNETYYACRDQFIERLDWTRAQGIKDRETLFMAEMECVEEIGECR